MCDTLCLVGRRGTLFAKNSDRPPDEVQLLEAFPRRPAGGWLRTQYLEIPDAGAAAVVGSRPEWLWGFEHGLNEHRVAIGNEKVFTTDDPYAAPPALIGMDLVRLGLERARSAEEALAVVTALIEEHGQGGIGDLAHREPYFSSFLIADPHGAWVLETSGRSWVARPAADGAAISNRLTLGTDWTRGSPDVVPGADWDERRNPDAPTGHADLRLSVTRACVAAGSDTVTPRELVATLRHHGTGPWGAPGSDPRDAQPPPATVLPDGTGVTVCMHVPGYMATTASMVAELPADPDAPLRAWIALGSPCVSVYVPVLPPEHVPKLLSDPETWQRFAALRAATEADPSRLVEIREVLGPLEAELWEEADGLLDDHGTDPTRWSTFLEDATDRVLSAADAALDRRA